MDDAVGSQDIAGLFEDAEQFLTVRPVGSGNIFPSLSTQAANIPDMVYFKLIPSASSKAGGMSYNLSFHGRYKKETYSRQAYYLGYKGGAWRTNTPAFVDIPKHPKAPPEGCESTMLLTGMLSGCSIVVTSLDETHYRVFHDPRGNASELHDNVVMAVDQDDAVGKTHDDKPVAAMDHRDYGDERGSLATVLMQYRGKHSGWKLYAQLLQGVPPAHDEYEFRDSDPEKHVITRFIDPAAPARRWLAEERIAKACKDRERVRQRMREIATSFNPAELPSLLRETDGEFVFKADEPIPKLSNAAVRGTRVYFEYFRGVKEKLMLVTQLQDDPGVGTADRDAARRMLPEIELLLVDGQDYDFLYLWQLTRREGGAAAVVQTEDVLRAGLQGATSGEKFDMLAARLRMTPNKAVTDGYAAYDRIQVRQYSAGMTSLDLRKLCLGSLYNLTDTQLGALLHRVDDAAEQEGLERLKEANRVIEYLLKDSGGKVKAMPQDVMLRLGGCGWSYPLVRAVAVALWADGEEAVDRIMAKLASLRTATPVNSSDARLLLYGLQNLRIGADALAASTARGRVTIEQAVEALQIQSGTASRMFMLHTEGHAMLLGATIRNAYLSSYHFYDPNFAMVTFDTTDALIKAMSRHLVTEQWATAYSASGTPMAPVFELVEICSADLSQVDVGFDLVVQDLSSAEDLSQTAATRARPNPDRVARELVGDPDFKRALAAADERQQTTWNSPWTWSGDARIGVPAQVLWKMYGLSLDQKPGEGADDDEPDAPAPSSPLGTKE
ncbi:hypothetical protein JDV02_003452 [Purpureocillium takamizusanense]|uniref:Uncharacterized protein n=1 Tax=Purpureocillium takamizusanense TaxID=2060973 RepID=A0A9Q8V8V4_9HYPO|nr:uncharacterized protein JDV02_003452 [Purpureocillium takamizusanense]UNI17073.1 hypothetical protein JDV02_003452 [Purpureocillium takamizusanense]